MVIKIKKVYFIHYILILFICSSCYPIEGRIILINDMQKIYYDNKILFSEMVEYFSDTISSYSFYIDFESNNIELSNSYKKIKFKEIPKNDNINLNWKLINNVINFMKKYKIRSVTGIKNWITFSFNNFRYPCFDFWYESDFDKSSPYVKKQIKNINDPNAISWIYILGGKWYIKGVPCF